MVVRFADAPLENDRIAAIVEELTRPVGAVNITSKSANGDPQIRIITTEDIRTSAAAERIRISDALIRRILAALKYGHVRLIGPPGTGKSTIARMVLEQARPDKYRFASATAQWTTEDIVGGPMPDPGNPNRLMFRPGLALEAAEADEWLCVDEINRADIDSAFGEFFSLLAGFDVNTPYFDDPEMTRRVTIYAKRPSGELDSGSYGIPESWRMIATMNSWDKLSLNRLSFAFSRRWCTVFIPVPNADDYSEILSTFAEEYNVPASGELFGAITTLFVRDEVATLRAIGLGLGPGIARSCIRDLQAMLEVGATAAEALAAAISGFVLPQFEGALDKHDEIEASISRVLQEVGASVALREQIAEELGVYTGRGLAS